MKNETQTLTCSENITTDISLISNDRNGKKLNLRTTLPSPLKDVSAPFISKGITWSNRYQYDEIIPVALEEVQLGPGVY